MPATINPVLPSLLTNAGAADGGDVHAESTLATNGEFCSCRAISVPAALACWLCTPLSEVTLMTSFKSPWPNVCDSILWACADCEVGSWNPPADRLLVTGMPKMAVATMTNSAAAMIRFGAAMASRAMKCSTWCPSPDTANLKLTAVTYQRQLIGATSVRHAEGFMRIGSRRPPDSAAADQARPADTCLPVTLHPTHG